MILILAVLQVFFIEICYYFSHFLYVNVVIVPSDRP